jgi:hypothetical protein
MSGDIQVYLRGGVYRLSATITFTPEDSGSNGYQISYQAYQAEKPIMSGGTTVIGWRELPDRPGIYQANLNRSTKLRALFVNGIRAKLTSKEVQGQGDCPCRH